MALALDFRNTNSLWCSVLAETLARLGVRYVVSSPGSRSTPLTLALIAQEGMETLPVLDERSAAFFALGLAKRTGQPTVLICTSGSAGANYLPAVVEASEAGVPLLIFTADRPPEMQSCSSGQTIDQLKLFGPYVRFFHELAVPEISLERLCYLRQTIAHGVETARGAWQGPVHFNCPFRDPLVPTPDGTTEDVWASRLGDEFFSHLGVTLPLEPARAEVRWPTERGLIVAGTYQPADESEYLASLAALSSRLQWPILADVLSPARRLPITGESVVITCYDSILRNKRSANDLTPAQVLCLGQWPTSKVLRAWLESSQVETVLVSPGPANRDALHTRSRHLPIRPEDLIVRAGTPRTGDYAAQWRQAEEEAREYIDEGMEDIRELFEPKAIWLLAQRLTDQNHVFVANSMPVRDAEYFWPHKPDGPRVFCNRGANGIDGNLSTALGLAHQGEPVYFVCGDLAFLHDSNALLTRPHFKGRLTVVLINNQGGGIFEHLPIAKFNPPFESHFATPQQVDFSLLCAAHGVDYTRIRDWEHFQVCLEDDALFQGIRVLEIPTERKRDASQRRAMLAAVADELS